MSDQKLKKSLGFSLVEVMVAAGILMILVMVISAVFVNANNNTAGIQLKLDYFNLENQLGVAFRNDSSCRGNLNTNGVVFPAVNLNLAATPTVQYFNSGGAAVSTVVPSLGAPISTGSRLSVTSVTVTNVQTLIANKEYVVSVQVNVQHDLSATHQFKPILIEGIRVNTDAGGNVTSCISNAKLICVTGFLAAQDYASGFPSGGVIRTNSDPSFVTTFSDVFTVIYSPPKWGLQCKSAPQQWIISGCTSSGLNNNGGGAQGTRPTVDDTVVANGCAFSSSDIPGTPQPSDGLLLTCCTTR